MATSGLTTFSISRDTIVREALAICGVIDETEAPSAEMITRGTISLNLFAKSLMAQGYHLWGLQECYLFLADGQASYSISASGDRCATVADTVVTTLTADAALGATTLSLASADMAISDAIGIVLADNSIQWTTIATIPGTTSVTIADALTGAASSGGTVYAYTTKIARPLRVTSAGVIANGIETPLSMMARTEYFDLPDKSSEGRPCQFYYDPQLTAGKFYVWPSASDGTLRLRLTVERPLEDFVYTADEPDFPIEWGDALTYGLAARLGPKYGVSFQRIAGIKALADEYLDTAKNFDRDMGSTFMTPGWQ
jgi:hypothetical protein